MATETRKQKELGELLRREISHILLFELKDPRMGFVTVTRVEAARDLRSARVYLTVRGSEGDLSKTLHGLVHARGYVQHLIGTRHTLRYTPVLEFRQDEELQKVMRLTKLIDDVRAQDKSAEDET